MNIAAGLPTSFETTKYEILQRCSGITKTISIPDGEVSVYVEPLHTDTPRSSPTPIATPYIYPSNGNQEESSSGSSDTSFTNDFSGFLEGFGWEKALLTVTTIVIGVLALGIVVLWRRTSRLIKNNQPTKNGSQ
jgi:hypothetical protein